MNIYPAYISKHNLRHEDQVILLKIPNGERWDYLTGQKLSALLRGIMLKQDSDFYCLKTLRY